MANRRRRLGLAALAHPFIHAQLRKVMKYSLPLKSGSYCSVVYKALAIGGAAYLAVPAAHAQQMTVSFDIPRMKVAEYHRPYIAIWIEDEKGKAVTTLRVLYDVDLKADDGRKWLADMRAWWRKAGRNTKMPADGVSGPTQAPGKHRVSFTANKRPLGRLAAGSYKLQVEAAREVGGRELVTVPFNWPGKGAKTYSGKGKTELGAVSLTIKP
jgi:hypothetical protein